MTDYHKRCDTLFAEAEAAVSKSQWNDFGDKFAAFSQALTHHLKIEEEILFPAFAEATGATTGPVQVMLMEHDQMRTLLSEMTDGFDDRDQASVLGVAETMLMMMQQHNVKEEQILYPMLDQALAASRDTLLKHIDSL